MAPTLTEFLLERIAEDEATARRAVETNNADRASLGWPPIEPHGGSDLYTSERAEVVISEARVLAECEAKRRIVDLARREEYFSGGLSGLGQSLLLALALPYSDHPDYRQEWKP